MKNNTVLVNIVLWDESLMMPAICRERVARACDATVYVDKIQAFTLASVQDAAVPSTAARLVAIWIGLDTAPNVQRALSTFR